MTAHYPLLDHYSLNDLRNRLISEGRYTDCVDELLVKYTGAKTVKLKIQ